MKTKIKSIEIYKHRNDLRYGKKNGLIPNIELPNWMKNSKIAEEKFTDDGK